METNSNLILSKQSNESEVKAYFLAILELKKSNKEFPVNLDDIWMLVYDRKDNAVKQLREYFIESVDYQVFRQNTENPLGGRPTIDYYLTVSCMEFFIARKVRSVFNVYRSVFHQQVEKKFYIPQTYTEALRLAADTQEKLEMETSKNLMLEQKMQENAPKVEYFDNVLQSTNTYSTTIIAKELGMSAQTLNSKLKAKNIQYKHRDMWVLYYDYQNKGYTKTTTQLSKPDLFGNRQTFIHTEWTEKGRQFIHSLNLN